MVRDMTNLARKKVDRVTILNLFLIIMLFSLPLATTALTTNSTTITSSGTIGPIATRPLHVEGNLTKDDLGNTIYLRGAGSWKFYLDPTGWFQPEGGNWGEGQQEWNEVNVRYHLQTMKDWGFNVFRLHTPADWWIQDQITVGTFSGSYRQIIKDLLTWAAEYGIYIMYDHFSPISFATAPNHASGLPYAPYVYNWEYPEQTYLMQAVFPNKQAFVDYWRSVADELKGYPNVIFELHNEPHALSAVWDLGYNIDDVRNDWFDAVQKCVNAIRTTGATQPIVIAWGLACPQDARGWEGTQYDPGNIDMSFVDHIGTTDPLGNLIYTGHTYKEYVPWSSDYDTLKAQMQDSKWEYAASKVPVLLGEFGVNQWLTGAALADHLLWAENFMKICNEWGIGYIGWNWSVLGGEDGGGGWGLISNEGALIYGPSPWGQVLIDAIADGGTMETG